MASALARRVAMLLAFVALGVAIAPVLAAKGAAASGEELRELRGRIEKLQADLASAEGNRGEAADLLKASGKAVSEAQRSLFELAQRRRTLEAQLAAPTACASRSRAATPPPSHATSPTTATSSARAPPSSTSCTRRAKASRRWNAMRCRAATS